MSDCPPGCRVNFNIFSLVTVYFVGGVEQKRRAQSFLSSPEPKAGKLVRSGKSPE